MSFDNRFVELDKTHHDRAAFECGENELNVFIRTQAARHMEIGISKTMLLPASVPLSNGKCSICAFYTIAPSSIRRETLPASLAKKLPLYPVPVFLLAQMAVHTEYQGKGFGKVTLIKALEYLWNMNAYMRAFAVIVDCLNEAAEQFYKKYGFEFLCHHNGRTRMFISMRTLELLFLSKK
ncbi:MAG: GNAT family N-acetyltransferase [Desulfocapsaceae bacterium]|nr:GNAT family N-acetyltransferase [Desulfocapsaceae bacterium]